MADDKPKTEDAGAAAAAAAEAATAAAADLNQQMSAASDSEGAQKSSDETSYTPDQIANWQRIEKEHGHLSKFTEVLQGRGITTTEDLTTNLDFVKKINDNPQLKQAVAALLAPAPSESDAEGKDGMTEDGVKSLMREMLTEQQIAQTKVQLQAAQVTEAGLLDQILAGEAFKNLTGGLTAKAIWGGEGPKLARAMSVLADDLLFQQGVTDPATGLSRPVTDPAAVAKVTSQLGELLKELKLSTLMELSKQPDGHEGPETVASDASVQSQLDTQLGGPTHDRAANERNDAMIAQTWKTAYQKNLAGSTGAPMSQGI